MAIPGGVIPGVRQSRTQSLQAVWLSLLDWVIFLFFADDDDDDDNAELSDEEAADGDANEAKQRQRRQQVQKHKGFLFMLVSFDHQFWGILCDTRAQESNAHLGLIHA